MFMNNLKFTTSTVVVAIVFLLSSCYEDGCNHVVDPLFDEFSSELVEAIRSKSATGEIAHYIIPDYTDYDAIPHDPNNPITAEKVALGMMLYHEPAAGTIPANMDNYQQYSCASCHPAACEYQPGISQGVGEGGWGFGMFGEDRIPNPNIPVEDLDVQSTKTPSAMNLAFTSNALWDAKLGARGFNEGTEDLWNTFPQSANHLGYDGIETQAIVGMEVHRISIDKEWVIEYNYKDLFDAAWPDIDGDERYTDLYAALAIAAYERTMLSCRAPFQEFLRGDYNALTESQKIGGSLFFGKGRCADCHTGTAFGNGDKMFAIGLNDLSSEVAVRTSKQMGRFAFTGDPDDSYKFKVPQLYNLKGVEHYGHGASMPSLRSMIEYCASGDPQNSAIESEFISPEFGDAELTKTELDYLDDFVRNALYDPEIKRHSPESLPSGLCFPNADVQSIIDTDCK